MTVQTAITGGRCFSTDILNPFSGFSMFECFREGSVLHYHVQGHRVLLHSHQPELTNCKFCIINASNKLAQESNFIIHFKFCKNFCLNLADSSLFNYGSMFPICKNQLGFSRLVRIFVIGRMDLFLF